MTFDSLITKLIKDSTSKAPKGDSYDSQNNWKPSGVASYSDGPGGRYRRTRPNTPGRSKATHGGQGVQDEEDTDTVEITLSKDLAKVLHDLLMSVVEAEDGESKGMIDKVADKVSDVLDIGKEWKDGTVIKSKPIVGVARRGAKIANRVGAEIVKSGINIAKAAKKGATEGGAYKRESRKSLKRRLNAEGFFAGTKKAFNRGKEAELYKGHEDAFIKMIDPHVEGFSREFLEALKDGINPEKQLERLEKEIKAAIEANGGLTKTIKKLVGYVEDDNPEEDAEYQGRKVTLNKPTRGDVKKFKVYVKDPKTGNVKKVNFGHGGTSAKSKGEKTMKIRKSNPKARKSFRARHKCDQKKSKTSAGYWSCRKW